MFITFEGIEGCGKTTQVERLAKRLIREGIKIVRTFEPGGTEIGETIRRLLLDSRNMSLAPLAELMLYAADRAQHVEEIIKPALDQGMWVICDRFFDATLAYQGSARGQDMELIRILNDRVTHGIRPDITFLLDCPVEMGLDRAMKRNSSINDHDQERFEREKINFHLAVREGYLDLARHEKGRFVVVDATSGEEEVERKIGKVLRPFLDAIIKGSSGQGVKG